MRPVNLLPARYRPRTGGSGDPKTAYFTLGGLALLVVAVFAYVMSANAVSERSSEIAEVRQQIAAAEMQAVTLKDFGNFAAIKSTRETAVRTLATTRTDWERLFRELAHVLPGQVWLTSFETQAVAADGGGEVGPSLLLNGCADSHGQIADVLVRLRELHVAADVQLSETTAPDGGEDSAAPATSDGSGEGDCGPYYAFEVEVALEASAAAPMPESGPEVPARLGGGE